VPFALFATPQFVPKRIQVTVYTVQQMACHGMQGLVFWRRTEGSSELGVSLASMGFMTLTRNLDG
jgi:hypothetical protein